MNFRGRSVRPLSFGTSGLRGLVSDITDLEAYVNTRGFLGYLRDVGEGQENTPVALAGDLRPSTDSPERSILRAVARAAGDAGRPVVYCGRIPTPALMAYAASRGWPSIMVTGSHIPFDRNGIKFNRARGEILKDDEPPILRAVEEARRAEYLRPAPDSSFGDDGMFRSPAPALPHATAEARDAYLRRYLDFFPPGALAGMRLALYAHSAVGAELLAQILTALGAEVFEVGRSAQFVAIDTEAISEAQLQSMKALVDQTRQRFGALDALVSTDGDSDRPLLLDIDERGQVQFFPGDLLGLVVADYLGADALAVPVTASDAIDRHFARRAVRLVRTRVGSPFVIAAAQSLQGSRRVGWEANGGFLTFSELQRQGRTLAPLPTRDAVLPIVAALHAGRERQAPLRDLFAALPPRFGAAGLIDGIPPDASTALVAAMSLDDPRITAARFGQGRAPVIEIEDEQREASGPLRARLEALANWTARHFGADRGFGAVSRIQLLDGLRASFDNGDVVHIRPSGNAPQLRVYALANTAERARAIVAAAIREPDGVLRELLASAQARPFVEAVQRNIAAASRVTSEAGQPAAVIGIVCGSAAAQRFWQRLLDVARPSLGAREAIAFHEDLPVNQAFGLLLLWQRLRGRLRPGEGALVAFVFGEGSRATPLTEADNGQKPAMASFVRDRDRQDGHARFVSVAELALRHFASVEAFLRRSGFDGVVVKWGDEIQVPTRDLSGSDPLFAGADVVRFVSLQAITAESAASKDWMGVDDRGRIREFVARRPLAEMQAPAARGVFERRGDQLWGGVNLGSIALSRPFLDAMLDEFAGEVADAAADRSGRPDLDPQLFTAMTIATIVDPGERERAFASALRETPAMRELERTLPGVLPRLRRVLDAFASKNGREARIVALDFQDQYWGDVGQHRPIFDFFAALNDRGPGGEVARALAGLPDRRDADGNILAGDTTFGGARVRNSVLIDCRIDTGEVVDSVLVGTRALHISAHEAFDVSSVASHVTLGRRAGSYKVVSPDPVVAEAYERITTVFAPGRVLLMRVREDTDLRDRAASYDVPILGNPMSFRAAHALMIETDPEELEHRRARAVADLLAAWPVLR
jgi:phosphomannomutase